MYRSTRIFNVRFVIHDRESFETVTLKFQKLTTKRLSQIASSQMTLNIPDEALNTSTPTQ